MAASVSRIPRSSTASAAAALASISGAQAVLALVTGPLQARALGPDGRGQLAAILVPLAVGPIILSLSLGAYASVQAARGKPAGEIFGSLAPILLLIGGTVALLSPAIAGYLANGHETVHRVLTVGLALMPLSLMGVLLVAMLGSLGMWRVLYAVRLIPILAGTGAIVTLYALQLLTTTTAASVAIGAAMLTLIPSLAALRGGGRVTFRRATAVAAITFGAKAWIGSLAALANARLDQLLMVRLTSTTQLGLYAVAVTLASLPIIAAGALGPPLIARVAAGDHAIASRSVRTVVALTTAIMLPCVALTPVILPLLFGDAFQAAVKMCLLLMLGATPLVGAVTLGPILTGLDRPGAVSFAELTALVVTVSGILLLVPAWGGVGAALATSAAAWLNFGILVWFGMRRLGVPAREFLLADRTDMRMALLALRNLSAAIRRRPRAMRTDRRRHPDE